MTDSCKNRFLFYTLKKKQAYPLKVFPKVCKTTPFIFANIYPNVVATKWVRKTLTESMQKLFKFA